MILAEKLRPNTVLKRLWQHILVDLIIKLPISKGYNSILVVYNRFLKMLYFIAMTEKIMAEDLAKLFRNNMWKLHGFPESIISDREPQFVVELIKELNEMLEIKTKLSIAFHLQTDRQMERINQELEQYLRIYINHRQSNWLEQLTTAEFAFNNKVHISTKSSLFKVKYRREPRMGFEIRKRGKHVKAEEFVKEMKKIHKEVKAALRKSQKEMKRQK